MQTTELKDLIAENESLRRTIEDKDREILMLMDDIAEMRLPEPKEMPWKPMPVLQPIETMLKNLSNDSALVANLNAGIEQAFPKGRWT